MLCGEISLIEGGDEIVSDLNNNEVNCTEFTDKATYNKRKEAWEKVVEDNDGIHPSVGVVDTRLLNRMRRSAVSAKFGAGMHPDRKLWVSEPRDPVRTSFIPANKHRPEFGKTF